MIQAVIHILTQEALLDVLLNSVMKCFDMKYFPGKLHTTSDFKHLSIFKQPEERDVKILLNLFLFHWKQLNSTSDDVATLHGGPGPQGVSHCKWAQFSFPQY